MFQPEIETLSREALVKVQLEGMRRTLARVKTNPAYHARLGRVNPHDISSP